MVLLDTLLDKLGNDKAILVDMIEIIHDDKSRKILPVLSLNPLVYDTIPYDIIQCSENHTLCVLNKMLNVGWLKIDHVDNGNSRRVRYSITDDGIKTVKKLFTKELAEVTPIIIQG